MIAPKKVYIPAVLGWDMNGVVKWDVMEIDTAAARKDRYNWVTPAPHRSAVNGITIFLTAADAWAWINEFRAYHGPMYTAAEIASIREG